MLSLIVRKQLNVNELIIMEELNKALLCSRLPRLSGSMDSTSCMGHVSCLSAVAFSGDFAIDESNCLQWNRQRQWALEIRKATL